MHLHLQIQGKMLWLMKTEPELTPERPSFLSYYRAAISEPKGFKPVPGGTGLGKTSAIPKLIATHMDKRKFIYCANRIQLLDEMESGLRAEGIGFVHLRRDGEIVKSVIENDKGALFELLESRELRHSLKVMKEADLLRSASHLEQAFELPSRPVLPRCDSERGVSPPQPLQELVLRSFGRNKKVAPPTRGCPQVISLYHVSR